MSAEDQELLASLIVDAQFRHRAGASDEDESPVRMLGVDAARLELAAAASEAKRAGRIRAEFPQTCLALTLLDAGFDASQLTVSGGPSRPVSRVAVDISLPTGAPPHAVVPLQDLARYESLRWELLMSLHAAQDSTQAVVPGSKGHSYRRPRLALGRHVRSFTTRTDLVGLLRDLKSDHPKFVPRLGMFSYLIVRRSDTVAFAHVPGSFGAKVELLLRDEASEGHPVLEERELTALLRIGALVEER